MTFAAQRLDRQTLEAALPALRPKLHRYCARMAGSVIDGEDILQETLVKALQALDGAIAVEKPEQWLFRIAHNAAQDHLRRNSRERARTMPEADISAVEDASESADRRYVAQAGLRTFMHLTVAQRSAVILVDVLGLSLHETCEVTGATLAAAKAALHRGRAELQRLVAAPEDAVQPSLSPEEEQRLRLYVDLFNARDFDGVRGLIAEDIECDVVNRARMRGKAQVSNYFGNYSRVEGWHLALGFVDGRPAILVRDPQAPGGPVRGFMLLEWLGDEVASIRDFRYAPYCLDGADIRLLKD